MNKFSNDLKWWSEKLLDYEALDSLSEKEFQSLTLSWMLLIVHYLRAEEGD